MRQAIHLHLPSGMHTLRPRVLQHQQGQLCYTTGTNAVLPVVHQQLNDRLAHRTSATYEMRTNSEIALQVAWQADQQQA